VSDGGTRSRKLLNAWSVGCGIACLLLVMLWVRSYRWYDWADNNFCSMNGKLWIGETFHLTGRMSLDPLPHPVPGRFGVSSLSAKQYNLISIGDGLALPYWLLLILFGLFTTFSSFRPPRFSLRTLLIAMTLAAVGFGLIVWALN